MDQIPAIADRGAFQAELDALRAQVKAHTREGDAIAAARRRLPRPYPRHAPYPFGPRSRYLGIQALHACPPTAAAAWHTDQMPGLPELDIARVRRWCKQRVPEHARDQVRVEYDIAPRHLTIVECRPPWRPSTGPEWTRFPIARLRYTQATRTWALYWRDRNLRFHIYDQLEPSPDIGDLLREIDRDPIAIFWG